MMVEVVHPDPSFVMQQQMPLVRSNSKEKIVNEFIAYHPFLDMVEMQYNEIRASLSPGEFHSIRIILQRWLVELIFFESLPLLTFALSHTILLPKRIQGCISYQAAKDSAILN